MPSALIAEDEPLLAAALADELARAWPELRVAATVGDGASAVQQALRLKPNVLFLDIRMPALSGLQAAAALADTWDTASAPFPALVFVTAYEQYAVQAFEAQALDYLLKPVQPERLQKTVAKLRFALATSAAQATDLIANSTQVLAHVAQQLSLLQAQLAGQPAPGGQASALPPLHHLPVSPAGTGGARVVLVPVDEVLLLQAADKYVRVLTANAEHLLRTPLKDLLPRLDQAEFWPIHRATVVRAGAIDSVQRDAATGRLHLRLRGLPDTWPVSRQHAHRFKPL